MHEVFTCVVCGKKTNRPTTVSYTNASFVKTEFGHYPAANVYFVYLAGRCKPSLRRVPCCVQISCRFFGRAGGRDSGTGDTSGRLLDPAGRLGCVQGSARGGKPRLEGLVPGREAPGVKRRVANAKREGGLGRVRVSFTPLRRGKRERLGTLDGVRTRPQRRVSDDTPVRFFGLAETGRIPVV